MDEKTEQDLDVVVIGGGAAGLSGALTLARSRRSVLVLDAGEPRNAPADGVHNYLGREGTPPLELQALGRAEVASYGGRVERARAVDARRTGDGFVVGLEDGSSVSARRLLVTTGLVDELPDVPGVRERWGREVLHCPYCHGWEVRDRRIAVLGSGPMAVHQALMLRQWSATVTLLLHTAPDPDDDQWEQLAARGIEVVEGEVSALEITDDALTGARLASGRVVPVDALAVMPHGVATNGVLDGLGLSPVEHPSGMGASVPVGEHGLAAPGVWVAGNLADVTAGVIIAAAAGMTAATGINADLVDEDTRRAVAERAEVEQAVAGQAAQAERLQAAAGRVAPEERVDASS